VNRRTDAKALAAIAALAVMVCQPASAYDTGSLTCPMIGELAAQTLAAKQSGKPQSATLTSLTAPLAEEARVERRLVGNIIETIYRNDLLVAMKPGDAYAVFLRDCLNGKQMDDRQ
jgi:hypothetical protein